MSPDSSIAKRRIFLTIGAGGAFSDISYHTNWSYFSGGHAGWAQSGGTNYTTRVQFIAASYPLIDIDFVRKSNWKFNHELQFQQFNFVVPQIPSYSMEEYYTYSLGQPPQVIATTTYTHENFYTDKINLRYFTYSFGIGKFISFKKWVFGPSFNFGILLPTQSNCEYVNPSGTSKSFILFGSKNEHNSKGLICKLKLASNYSLSKFVFFHTSLNYSQSFITEYIDDFNYSEPERTYKFNRINILNLNIGLSFKL